MDSIHIRDLRLRACIGVYPEERLEKQDVVVNLEIGYDLSLASISDDLRDTLDYKALKQEVIRVVESSSDQLIERLAGRIAECCLAHERVLRVKVVLDKPGALRFARSVAVEIVRSKVP